MSDLRDARPSRRIVFHGLGALGVAAVLAGCGGGGGDDGAEPAPTASAGATLVPTNDVPVGGGVILTDQRIVVTQPTQGTFKAFSAVCTHEGNLVGSVDDDVIVCHVHNSHFSAVTGDVESGPAPSPLPPVSIKVVGTNVVAA